MRAVSRLLLVALVTMALAALPLVAAAAPGGNGNGGDSAATPAWESGNFQTLLGDVKHTDQWVRSAPKRGELTLPAITAVFDTLHQAVTLTGTGLQPGSDLTIHIIYPNKLPVEQVIGTVHPDGTFSWTDRYACTYFTVFWVSGTAAFGTPMSSLPYRAPC